MSGAEVELDGGGRVLVIGILAIVFMLGMLAGALGDRLFCGGF